MHTWADINGRAIGAMDVDTAEAWFREHWGPVRLYSDDDGLWLEDAYTGEVVGQTFDPTKE